MKVTLPMSRTPQPQCGSLQRPTLTVEVTPRARSETHLKDLVEYLLRTAGRRRLPYVAQLVVPAFNVEFTRTHVLRRRVSNSYAQLKGDTLTGFEWGRTYIWSLEGRPWTFSLVK